MLDWVIPAICGVVVLAVLVKAFWKAPRPDPDKKHGHDEPPGTGRYL
jgi:hypothetical protein